MHQYIRANKQHRFQVPGPGIYTVGLGNMSQFEIFHYPVRGGLLIGVIGKGCYIFGHPPHPGYVEEKLRVIEGDANNIADYIADLMGSTSPERHGNYHEDLLKKEAA